MTIHNAKCAAAHINDWAIHSEWFGAAVKAIKEGVWPISKKALETEKAASDGSYAPSNPKLMVTQSGVAIISLEGALMKAESKYGGTSTIWFRQQMRQAVAEKTVKAIVLHIDSPGGTVAGTSDAAEEVAKANAIKPVYAHIDDLGASAAYWIASQARGVYANTTALVGSIGTYSVLYDASKMAEMQGIEVHVIATGEYKGAGVPGSKITEAHLEYAQERINSLNQYFLNGVSKGRGMKMSEVKAVADGRVFVGKEAKALGLVDKIQNFDATVKMAAGAARRNTGAKGAMIRTRMSTF